MGVPSLETSSPTPEPATASPSPRAQLNWQKIKAACKKLVTEKQAAVQSWDMVKTAIPAMLEDKKETPATGALPRSHAGSTGAPTWVMPRVAGGEGVAHVTPSLKARVEYAVLPHEHRYRDQALCEESAVVVRSLPSANASVQ